MSAPPGNEFSIRHAETADKIACFFPLMHQLRPHLGSAAEFLDCHRRQATAGYRLLVRWADDSPVALAGYRVSENLIHARHLYVDDLVTHQASRSHGHGKALLMHLQAEAKSLGCVRLVLDSAMSNTEAHRSYQSIGLAAVALHFSINLP